MFIRYLLTVGPGFTDTKWNLPGPVAPATYNLQVKLPAGLVCNKQCIFQVNTLLEKVWLSSNLINIIKIEIFKEIANFWVLKSTIIVHYIIDIIPRATLWKKLCLRKDWISLQDFDVALIQFRLNTSLLWSKLR